MIALPRSFLSVFCTSALAFGQSLSLSAAAAADVFAEYGTTQQSFTLPAGPMVSPGGLFALASLPSVGDAFAELSWSGTIDARNLDVMLAASALANGAGPTRARVEPVDVLVTVTSATPIPIALDLELTIQGTAGTAIPIARVDVGDDGIFELTESMPPQPVSTPALAGPAPLVIRCSLGCGVEAAGSVIATLRVTGRPANTLINRLQPGCTDAYILRPRFDGDLEYDVSNYLAGAAVAVFGLTTQPLLLGTVQYPAGPPLPCLLLPRVDFVSLLSYSGPELLVIPPAARPITFYSQAVYFGGPLATTSGYGISAF